MSSKRVKVTNRTRESYNLFLKLIDTSKSDISIIEDYELRLSDTERWIYMLGVSLGETNVWTNIVRSQITEHSHSLESIIEHLMDKYDNIAYIKRCLDPLLQDLEHLDEVELFHYEKVRDGQFE